MQAQHNGGSGTEEDQGGLEVEHGTDIFSKRRGGEWNKPS